MLEHVGMVQGIHNIQLLLELMGDEGVCSTHGAQKQDSKLEGQLQQPRRHDSLQLDSLACIPCGCALFLLPSTPAFLASLSDSGCQGHLHRMHAGSCPHVSAGLERTLFDARFELLDDLHEGLLLLGEVVGLLLGLLELGTLQDTTCQQGLCAWGVIVQSPGCYMYDVSCRCPGC